MKRCPKCRREYTDETLNFCLEDGAWLREVGDDEPATAIQPPAERTVEPSASGKNTGDETVLLSRQSHPEDAQRPTSSAEYLVTKAGKHRGMVAIVAAAVLVAIVGFGYWYFKSASTPLTPSPIASIAVLPFQNRNSDPDTDYLSDGLAESLIFRLSQLPGLKVSPTTSVIRYKGSDLDMKKIAGELGVDSIMTGRLVKRGDNLNITVELVDVRNNKTLWGEQYERKMADLLMTQREIATTIAQKLELKLSSGESTGITKKYTDSNEAYQLYLKGRYHFAKRTKPDLLQAADYYRQAIDADPNFALAYARIAEDYLNMPSYPYISSADALPQARAALQRSLELDPELAEGHTFNGFYLASYEWKWADAEKEFKRALELDPNNSSAHFRYGQVLLMPTGRFDEALAEMKKALDLEPLDITINATYAWANYVAGQKEKALDVAGKTFDLEPGHPIGSLYLAAIDNAMGMHEQALAVCDKGLAKDPNSQFMLTQTALAYASMGKRDQAEDILKRLQEIGKTNYVASYNTAATLSRLGRRDEAFAALEKSYQNREWLLQRINIDPFLVELRSDPRFDSLVQRINLSKPK